MGEDWIKNFDRRTLRKLTIRIFRFKWKDNIKMDIEISGMGGVNWVHWGQYRDQLHHHVSTVMNLWVPDSVGNFLGD
jgi:hypothetical protein